VRELGKEVANNITLTVLRDHGGGRGASVGECGQERVARNAGPVWQQDRRQWGAGAGRDIGRDQHPHKPGSPVLRDHGGGCGASGGGHAARPAAEQGYRDCASSRLACGMEVLDVDAGVTRVVEEAGAGAEPPLKRMRLEQAASERMVRALQERLVAVKKEQVEERATRHSELRASVDAKVKAAVKEALAQVTDALECACCFEPPRRCGPRVRAHLLQPTGVRLLVGDEVPRVSAAHRSARAALWGACQRVRASAPRRLTRAPPCEGEAEMRTEGREGREGIKGHYRKTCDRKKS